MIWPASFGPEQSFRRKRREEAGTGRTEERGVAGGPSRAEGSLCPVRTSSHISSPQRADTRGAAGRGLTWPQAGLRQMWPQCPLTSARPSEALAPLADGCRSLELRQHPGGTGCPARPQRALPPCTAPKRIPHWSSWAVLCLGFCPITCSVLPPFHRPPSRYHLSTCLPTSDAQDISPQRLRL